MGAARVETNLTAPTTTAETPQFDSPQASFAPKPQPTQTDKAKAQAEGIKLYHAKMPKGIIGRLKEKRDEITDSDPYGWLGNKMVGGSTSLEYKATTMYGPEQRLNPSTGKEHGYLNYHRNLQADNVAMDAAKHGYVELDNEGVAHVVEDRNNFRYLVFFDVSKLSLLH